MQIKQTNEIPDDGTHAGPEEIQGTEKRGH